ncbi:uncharacterized protein LOC109829562 [Asparagus officinalis]|uniref:uncharacterized protein LOC109829562 n=1 Tax=Asparagus officinalis TaxID=4686 RepID=UPI00098E6B64|nr:uncharacterized protein LOC109829562 [Asparagus officinalis]
MVINRFGNVENVHRVLATCLKDGNIQISSIYSILSHPSATVTWSNTVWGGLHYPKHSLIMWLAVLSRLLTKDRLCRMKILDASQNWCVLCIGSVNRPESKKHLFFECQFSGFVWNEMMEWLGFTWRSCDWDHVMNWFCNNMRGLGFIKKMKRMVLSATIYWIWKERNSRIFQQKCRSPDQIVREVKLSVLMKVLHEDIPDHLREKVERL